MAIADNDDILFLSSDVMETPLRAIPESKKSFLPSLSEKQKVGTNTDFQQNCVALP